MRIGTVRRHLFSALRTALVLATVPTAVTGWFGQNIPYLGFGRPLGVWMSVAVIVGAAGGLWLLFRRLDWL